MNTIGEGDYGSPGRANTRPPMTDGGIPQNSGLLAVRMKNPSLPRIMRVKGGGPLSNNRFASYV
jgi:hypothetical protein